MLTAHRIRLVDARGVTAGIRPVVEDAALSDDVERCDMLAFRAHLVRTDNHRVDLCVERIFAHGCRKDDNGRVWRAYGAITVAADEPERDGRARRYVQRKRGRLADGSLETWQ
jgi:hypothetical protein